MTRYQPRVDTDEYGFRLVIPDPHTGEDRYTFPLDASCLDAFYDQVKARIGPYLREMHDAHADFLSGAKDDVDGFPRRSFVCAPADVDESGGYEPSDPKHENFHSLHADLWDSRDGK